MVISTEDIEQFAVVGGGEMGRGIAAVAALAGYRTTLNDIDESQLREAKEQIEWSYGKLVDSGDASARDTEAASERLRFTTDLVDAVSETDFVTEAVVEQQSIKEDVLAQLDEAAPPEAILASNTSGLNITQLAETTGRPGQVIGTHWFNPPVLMELVEVVRTEYTPENVLETAESVIESFGKTSIRCDVDVPSFIVNRLMRPYGEEPAWMVYRGEHSIREIDSAMKFRAGFPMGPFELADFTGGIQVRVEGESDHLEDERPLSYDTRVCPLLHQLYEKGRYGVKADAGYYHYDEGGSADIPIDMGQGFDVLLVWAPIVNEAAKMVEHGVASANDIDTGAKLGGNWPTGPLDKCDEVGAEVILQKLMEVASAHTVTNKAAESLPCSLLIEKAKTGGSFH